MNKKLFVLIIIFLLLLLTVIYVTMNRPKESSLPDFMFYTLNGKEFTQEDVENGKNVFIYINPECKICEYSLSKLQFIQDSLLSYNIYIVSSSSLSNINKILLQYNILSIPNVKVLLDSGFKFEEIFMVKVTPSAFVYDFNHNLTNCFQGVSEIDEFFDYLLNHNCE